MRTAAAVSLLCLCSCTSLTMAEPQILVSPYLAVYQLRGDVGMTSNTLPSGSSVPAGAQQSMRQLGQDHHHEDTGVRVDVGDGFGGLRVDYYQLDMGSAHPGPLAADFGNLVVGDVVRLRAHMDEIRIGYLEPVFDVETEYRDQPLQLRCAAGAVIAHRSMTLRTSVDDGSRVARTEIDGDVVYPALRAQFKYRDFALDLDYAISPELDLSGDYDGLQQDFEARLGYTLPMRDVTFFAGYRYSEFPAKGSTGGLAYDADLKLDGYQFGLVLTF